MKNLRITTLLMLTLTMAACSASPTTAAPTGSTPMATQLIIGTLKLDGTAQDITAEQAKELLPMWQVYSGLLTSDTAAQEEIDGLISQIQSTMTDEQMQAITDMNLASQDVMTVMQEKGLGMGNGQAPSADQVATAQALRQSGDNSGFAGGPPDGGGMPMSAPPDGGGIPGGGLPSAGQSSSAGNTTTTGTAGGLVRGGVPSALIEALIEMLKTKASS